MVTEIGVLGLQGDFEAHGLAVERAGGRARIVRWPRELDGLAGLILPGGESTTLLRLMEPARFEEALRRYAEEGGALFGTCAGAILLARRVLDPEQRSLGLIDIDVRRNAYGRQADSFETVSGTMEPRGGGAASPLEMVFIRAPRIVRCGEGVEILARHAGEPVLVRQGRILAGTFHPELGKDARIHRLFLEMASHRGAAAAPAGRREASALS